MQITTNRHFHSIKTAQPIGHTTRSRQVPFWAIFVLHQYVSSTSPPLSDALPLPSGETPSTLPLTSLLRRHKLFYYHQIRSEKKKRKPQAIRPDLVLAGPTQRGHAARRNLEHAVVGCSAYLQLIRAQTTPEKKKPSPIGSFSHILSAFRLLLALGPSPSLSRPAAPAPHREPVPRRTLCSQEQSYAALRPGRRLSALVSSCSARPTQTSKRHPE